MAEELVELRAAIAHELELARDGDGYEADGVAAEIVRFHAAPPLAAVRKERDLLLWLHAEAVWWLALDRDEHESAEVLHMWSKRVAYLEARVGHLKNTIGEQRTEMTRLRREVEFEANAEVPRSNGLSLPLCSCVTAEQAAQIASAGPLWTPPQCAVHPDGGDSDG